MFVMGNEVGVVRAAEIPSECPMHKKVSEPAKSECPVDHQKWVSECPSNLAKYDEACFFDLK